MSNWQSGFITANGIRLHYHRTGGDKPPLVLAHGITDNGLCWTRLARALEDEYDIIMVDARGHGLSDKPEHGYAPGDHAADLAGLIQALELGKIFLMGHSMGAYTVAAVVANHPELVRAAVLEDPPWWPVEKASSPAEAQAVFEEWRRSILERQTNTVEEIAAAGRAQSPAWHADEFPAWAESKLQVHPNAAEYVLVPGDAWPDLVQRFQCPVLLITGDPERGAIVNDEVAEQAAALNPRVQHLHVPGTGHNIRREGFEQVVAGVRAFLRSVPV